MADNHPILEHAESELDVSGLLCPLPVLRARKRLEAMQPGTVLLLTATDPMSTVDVPHFCTEQGHALLTSESSGSVFQFRIRRK